MEERVRQGRRGRENQKLIIRRSGREGEGGEGQTRKKREKPEILIIRIRGKRKEESK